MGYSYPNSCQDSILHKANPSKTHKYKEEGKNEKMLNKDWILLKKSGRKLTLTHGYEETTSINPRKPNPGHATLLGRRRGDHSPRMEAGSLHFSVLNDHLAVWDGKAGASGLQSPAPSSTSPSGFIFLV